MRRDRRFCVTPGGALLLGALVFLLRFEDLAALAAAVGVHELGHVLVLTLVGAELHGVSFEATGPVLHCALPERSLSGVLAALAGPAAGIGFWVLLRADWTLAAEMSLVLAAVNLLPVLPLDGGCALAYVVRQYRGGDRLMRAVRILVLLLLTVLGIYCAAARWGFAPLLLAFWLLVVPSRTCKTALNDVKYSYSYL